MLGLKRKLLNLSRLVRRFSGGLEGRGKGEKKSEGITKKHEAKECYGPEKSGGVRIGQKQRAKKGMW